MTAVNVPIVKANRRAMIAPNTPKYSPNSDRENSEKKKNIYIYIYIIYIFKPYHFMTIKTHDQSTQDA